LKTAPARRFPESCLFPASWLAGSQLDKHRQLRRLWLPSENKKSQLSIATGFMRSHFPLANGLSCRSPGYSENRLNQHAAIVLFACISCATSPAQEKEIAMHHAHGTFTVDVHPLAPPPAEGLSRYTINKTIHGDLEATTKGEMFGAGDPKQGAAGYVAIEMVTGTVEGKHGSFALEHLATMDASGPKMQVIVVPGSGSGGLKGISGTFEIRIEDGQHLYDFDYTLQE
jgi:hypothetical protein